MAKPSNAIWSSLRVGFVLGTVLAIVLVPVLARTNAIAAPPALFAWFKGNGLLPLELFSWDVLVVYGLSIALPAIVSLVLLFRFFSSHRIVSAASFSIAVLVSLYLFVPLYFGQPGVSPFGLPWWQHGLVVALLLAFGLALGVSRIFRISNRPSGRDGIFGHDRSF